MCRSIVCLRGEELATEDELASAALQFVRKISGYRAPSQANQAAFDRAVSEISNSVRTLLDDLVVPPGTRPPQMAHSRVVARSRSSGRTAGN